MFIDLIVRNADRIYFIVILIFGFTIVWTTVLVLLEMRYRKQKKKVK